MRNEENGRLGKFGSRGGRKTRTARRVAEWIAAAAIAFVIAIPIVFEAAVGLEGANGKKCSPND